MDEEHTVDLSPLADGHRRRLQWFHEQRGFTVPFPGPLEDGLLVTRAKGIYKPADLEYALSVRVMQASPYADKAIEEFPDGSWSLDYFQENPDPHQKMAEYTNRGLDACQRDRVPVGVLVQVAARPALYSVVGLALVTGWSAGMFHLESASPRP